jgi:hypothetical protein
VAGRAKDESSPGLKIDLACSTWEEFSELKISDCSVPQSRPFILATKAISSSERPLVGIVDGDAGMRANV